jgi:hypothetical protein
LKKEEEAMAKHRIYDVPGSHFRSGFVPAVAAAAVTETHPIFQAPVKCKGVKVHLLPRAGVTGDNTNRKNLNVKKGPTEIGNLDLVTGVNLAALTRRTITLTQTALDEGGVLSLEYEKVGTGMDVPDLDVEVEFVPT